MRRRALPGSGGGQRGVGRKKGVETGVMDRYSWFPGFFPSLLGDSVCVTQVACSLHSECQFGHPKQHLPAARADPDPDLGEPPW